MAAAARHAGLVSPGTKQYFFGYYDKFADNASGRFILAHAVDFLDRSVTASDTAEIGVFDQENGGRFIPITDTRAWCWQQGAMLQWWPARPETHIVFNDIRHGRYAAVIRDWNTGEERELPRPVAAVSRDGTRAVSLNFSRLAVLRPGYGYEGIPDPWKDVAAPDDDGIYHVDMMAGGSELIISLSQIMSIRPDSTMLDATHWFNHCLFSPGGERFLFLHRWTNKRSWYTRLFTANVDGSDIRLLNDHEMTSHCDWRDDTHVLAYARRRGIGDRYYLFDDVEGSVDIVGGDLFARDGDGHCNYSPDRRWIISDSYPIGDKHERVLFLFHPESERRVDLGAFYAMREITGDTRCDLHPRWTRDGKAITFDSTHDGKRNIYRMDVSDIVG